MKPHGELLVNGLSTATSSWLTLVSMPLSAMIRVPYPGIGKPKGWPPQVLSDCPGSEAAIGPAIAQRKLVPCGSDLPRPSY